MSFGVDRSVAFRHDTKRMATVFFPTHSDRWLLAPALLLFVLFFVLPFGVMAGMSSSRPTPSPIPTLS